ncbi:hypothetical protein [Buchananella felis]|uniref:hypothetical protein n=1 Tax=Buchananella felis TaxID=3231492 RepID=UPI0035279A3A
MSELAPPFDTWIEWYTPEEGQEFLRWLWPRLTRYDQAFIAGSLGEEYECLAFALDAATGAGIKVPPRLLEPLEKMAAVDPSVSPVQMLADRIAQNQALPDSMIPAE